MSRRCGAGAKKITVWNFKVDSATISVPVHLVENSGGYGGNDYAGPERPGKPPHSWFRVRMTEPAIDEDHYDIDELKKTVEIAIREKSSIQWRPMLHVVFEGDRDRLFGLKDKADTINTQDGAGAELNLRWSRVRIAELRGKKIWSDFQHTIREYAPDQLGVSWEKRRSISKEVWSDARDGWPEVGIFPSDDEDYNNLTTYRALIDDTPENRLGLEQVADAMAALQDRLGLMFSPKMIDRTLEQVKVGGLKALPAAEISEPKVPTRKGKK